MRQIILIVFTVSIVQYTIPIKKTSLSDLLKRKNCTTPSGENGSCTYVYLCKPILDILPNDKTPISKEILELVTAYMCSSNEKTDTENRNLLVCCPKHPISLEDEEIGFYPPDVSNHKNLKLLPKFCGITEDSFRIAGGHEASLFEFTWMAHLSYKTSKGKTQYQCGGTIINDRYILTAAHCLTYLKNKTLSGIKVGDYNTALDEDCEYYPGSEIVCADPVQNLKVNETIVHPDFNYVTLINDIALIRVSEKIKIGQNNISPVCLPIYKNLREINLDRAVVTGWGKDENRRNSKVLRKVGLNIIDHYQCRRIYYKFSMILSHLQICAGDEGRDACDGDSGGPLQALVNFNGHTRYCQFGVISFGPADCGRRNRPGIYVNLIYYMKWILDNIKE